MKSIISKDELKARIYALEDGESLFFRRDSDLYGWGITKATILWQAFLFIGNFEDGDMRADTLAEDYRDTNDHFDMLWDYVTHRDNEEDRSIRIVSFNEANAMNPNHKK